MREDESENRHIYASERQEKSLRRHRAAALRLEHARTTLILQQQSSVRGAEPDTESSFSLPGVFAGEAPNNGEGKQQLASFSASH